ncbi:MAG TPA: flagellar motor protein MotA [Rhodospirillaceae bacterium]|nr:flagellar motor protein MotA [Candidatus Neomarinimicrobiota bacterium]HCX13968.1 flagellar motor protein MotA [Rhodospirillaceae bacterium]
MTDTKTYLTRMIVFLTVVGVAAAFIGQDLVSFFMANPLLNGLILSVILTGILINFRQVGMLGPESRWIERFRSTALEGGTPLSEGRVQPEEVVRLRLLSPMARMLEEKRGRGRVTLSAPVMRTLLDGIAARLDESRELARYFTGLCIFLGLLGTFWGLLGTVASIGDVIRNLSITGDDITVTFNALKSGLEEPLTSMGTAFSTSLFGLAGSLILGFFDLQAGQAQNHFYNDLEEWLSGLTRLSSGSGLADSEQGVSAYTEALLEQSAESLNELQAIMARGETVRSAGSEQLIDLNDKLSLLADQLQAGQTVLIRMSEEQRELAPAIRKFNEVAEKMMAPQAATSIDDATRSHIRSIDTVLNRMSTALSTGRDDTVREIRNEIKLLAKTVAGVTTRDSTPSDGN